MALSAARLEAARLQAGFSEAIKNGTISGSDSLEELARLAFACASGGTSETKTVALALTAILDYRADCRDGGTMLRALTSAEIQLLSNAVAFISDGGNASDAVRTASALAVLTEI